MKSNLPNLAPRSIPGSRSIPPASQKRNRGYSTLLWISIAIFLGAVVLLLFQINISYHLERNYPHGIVIGGVPVGGLDRQESISRLAEVYSRPVMVYYDEAVMYLNPSTVDFRLDIEGMLAEVDQAVTRQGFWEVFWDFLWGRKPKPLSLDIPLKASFSETDLNGFLEEIALRYDRFPRAGMPIAGTTQIRAGSEGIFLDQEHSIPLIEKALQSPTNRLVKLPLKVTKPLGVSLPNLETFLKQTIKLSGFDGLAAVYFLDLQTAQEIHFAYQLGEDVPVKPDIAFSAGSIIKIPIILSVLRRTGENPHPETLHLLQEMIEKSGNDPANWVMEQVIDQKIAPILVTADMTSLGLENTFLAGYFYPGAPLLEIYQTPANQRPDVNTDPDLYNQTTAVEMGILLEDLYQCSQFGGGAILAVFQGEITQAECQTIITYLTRNKVAALIEAGVPDGTRIAHKHGWVSYSGIMHTLGDASIIYSPGGDYILVVFLYQPTQLVWEPASRLVADLSRVVYSYFNPWDE